MDDIAESDRRAPEDPKDTPGDAEATRRGRTGPAFVVQLTPDPAPDAFCGRVQHLATLDGGNFSSPDGLIAIMRRVLERKTTRDPTDDQ